MAEGFWKRLLNSAFREAEEKALAAAEAERLKKEGYVRKHYYISGRVQEVGFRYTAFYLAEQLGLTGWVCNLDDGRVELEAQGKAEAVERLIGGLNGRGRILISGVDEEERPLLHEETFRVRG